MGFLNTFRDAKYLLAAISLLFIIFAVGAGGWIWNNYGRHFGELEKKDPEHFGMIMDELRGLNFLEARRLFIELDQMTPNQVSWNRFRRLKEKLRDDNFKQEVMAIRKGIVERARARQIKFHAGQISEVDSQPDSAYWNEIEPWQKGLALRETCQRILSETKRLSASFCDHAIPLGHEDRFVTRALESLKLELDYFDFSRILREAGIPTGSVLSPSGKLKKMTGSLGGG